MMWNGPVMTLILPEDRQPLGTREETGPLQERSNHEIFRGRKCYPKNLAPDQTVKQVLKETNGQEPKRCGVYESF